MRTPLRFLTAATFACLLLAGRAPALVGAEPTWTPPGFQMVEAALDGLEFDDFVETSYRLYLLRFPQAITHLGLAEAFGVRNDRLDDYSPEYLAETERIERLMLERLRQFDRASLSPRQQETYDVSEWTWEDKVRGQAFAQHDYLVTHDYITSRDWQLYDLLTEVHPLSDVRDVEDYLARLACAGAQFDQLIGQLEARAERGIVAPRIVLGQAIAGLQGLAAASAERHPFTTRLADRLASVSGLTRAERDRLQAEAETLVLSVVLPGYRRLYQKLIALQSIAPTSLGCGGQPDGAAYYTYALRHQNQTDLSASEIHRIGLEQVARLRVEIDEAATRLGYPAGLSIPGLFDRVARDGGALRGAGILAEYDRLLGLATQRATSVFESLPSIPVEVVGDIYGGYYRPAPTDASRPAQFVAPASGSQPRYSMPTLTYHETIPGHHLQIATAAKLDLPLLRTVETYLGYTEGWALYAERLAWELGWYEDDPYGNLGRLSDEMMRAVRLVVDTGIHVMGWSFDEAVDCFVEQTGRPGTFAQGQILRYAVWPGQSTAYMIGLLTMLDLRERVRDALGDAFDLAAYHTIILEGGSLPLALLGQAVERFVAQGGARP